MDCLHKYPAGKCQLSNTTSGLYLCKVLRGVFKPLKNICDGTLSENSSRLVAVNYFQKVSSSIFDMDLNAFLLLIKQKHVQSLTRKRLERLVSNLFETDCKCPRMTPRLALQVWPFEVCGRMCTP